MRSGPEFVRITIQMLEQKVSVAYDIPLHRIRTITRHNKFNESKCRQIIYYICIYKFNIRGIEVAEYYDINRSSVSKGYNKIRSILTHRNDYPEKEIIQKIIENL